MASRPPVCREHVRSRILMDCLGPSQQQRSADWGVLVVDPITVKVLSSACTVSDLVEHGFSLVEDLWKNREPQPEAEAVYFISPTEDSIDKLVSDFTSEQPLYLKAHVYFSSAPSSKILTTLREHAKFVNRLVALKELNLEFLILGDHAFTTDSSRALRLVAESIDDRGVAQMSQELTVIAKRLTTFFLCMKMKPRLRFHRCASDAIKQKSSRRSLSEELASLVYEQLDNYSQQGLEFPTNQACDLLIVDRSFDLVAPLIHEWTYESLCYDLIPMQGCVYKYCITNNRNEQEEKEVLLDEKDKLWVELRYLHIAEALLHISQRTEEFRAKNQASTLREDKDTPRLGNSSSGTQHIRRLVQSLPQYREQLSNIATHATLAEDLNSEIKSRSLNIVGKLEQDIVHGKASSKELLKLFETHSLHRIDKLRLLLCYCATQGEKFDPSTRLKWMRLAGLSADDMSAISSLEFLQQKGETDSSKSWPLTFSKRRGQAFVRKERTSLTGESWELSGFEPRIHSVVKDLICNELPLDVFPSFSENVRGEEGIQDSRRNATSGSVRSTTGHWAKRQTNKSMLSTPTELKDAFSEQTRKPKRTLVIFVIGGMSHSETRVAHEACVTLEHDVILGSTSLDTPAEFIENLKRARGEESSSI
mmetsp:Transcript_4591/g.16039  ORF Transcript_4591/g.16039 Transcript_4591/m.16039 type:complete len:649 (+) Transcript_4591:162-2108(+)|eukprot:CAMPEP_0183796290 /NCGR_PEP_ID=MMETSP0803_2-20130417/9777_1 /TAXON_ID=195967 /ORGANISM="Crustomastix stigmata, Strain CCMP3273" /LENGTH=648 /DNA_ID=CAMNT_0026040915 /DNA_START=124 /DNA_END=2070 /DNA_ORIENTATION=-